MKKLVVVVLGLFVVSAGYSQKRKSKKKANYDPVPYAKTITEEELKEHLYTYASDEFEGRNTGDPGQKKAVNYLKEHYESLGIKAAQANGDYFQKVPLEKSGLPEVSLSINGTDYPLGENFFTFSGIGNKTVDASKIIYAGYGIDDEKYSDYNQLDVEGKIVLIKAGEPKNEDGTYVISGTNTASKWSNLAQSFNDRIGKAQEKGAKGLLFYDDVSFGLIKPQFERTRNRGNGQISLKNGEQSEYFFFFVDSNIAKALHPKIDETATAATIDAKFSTTFESTTEEVSSENVVAFIKGTEKPDEYVVISAHLDHEGVKGGEVYNGADDDGSGTVAVLEIAEAFKKAADEGNGPKRSIVFLHVTGEEKGLLGSAYYTDNPIFPLKNTVTDLNIDMIGRTDPKREGDRNYVYLIGSDKLSTELHNISEQVNSKYMNITLDYTYNDENDPNRFYYRSDHYNFAKHNVPIIFYFNGTHADYHRPSDTPDKIQYDLLTNRAQLVFHTAWEVANRDNRIIADKATDETED